MIQRNLNEFAAADDRTLLCRWPDADLAHSFRGLSAVYGRLLRSWRESRGRPDRAAAFEAICSCIRRAVMGVPSSGHGWPIESTQERRWVSDAAAAILKRSDGLQRLASLLAMLSHLAVDQRTADLLVNRRRPQKLFPTYPTSPALARFAAQSILERLLKEPLPKACASTEAARRYAARAYGFRVIDPSMESGQLLLGVAQAALERIHRHHPKGSQAGRLLGRAALAKLFRGALWGIDQNELAINAVSLLFAILGSDYGLEGLEPAHLIKGNALHTLPKGRLADFDGLLNNPPWGVAMDARERKRLHKEFKTIEHRPDLYISFTEMALRSVRPGGALVLILPSQALAARNTRRLRSLLLEQMGLEKIVLLPRAAFSSATVRGVVLVGRRGCPAGSDGCRVTAFPLTKRLDAPAKPRSFHLTRSSFEERGGRSWWPVIGGGPFLNGSSPTLPLEQVARVALGVQVHHVGRGDPPQTPEVVRKRSHLLNSRTNGALPAVRGREVVPFRILESKRFVRLGKWLSWAGDHDELRRQPRILVRELCRRDGQLSAASATDGQIPLHGVLTLVPKLIGLRVLLGILNSSAAADYVRRHTASFSKVDFQKITLGEMRQLPLPAAALDVRERQPLGLSAPTAEENTLREDLIAVVREIECCAEAKEQRLLRRLNGIVARMYGRV